MEFLSPSDRVKLETRVQSLVEEILQDMDENEITENDSASQTIRQNNTSISSGSNCSSVPHSILEEARAAGLAAKLDKLKKKNDLERQMKEYEMKLEEMTIEMELEKSKAKQAVLSKYENMSNDPTTILKQAHQSIEPTTPGKDQQSLSHVSPKNEKFDPATYHQVHTHRDGPAEVMRRMHLPKMSMETFGGDIMKYRSFVRQFENNIASKTDDEDEKLYYLEQMTSDNDGPYYWHIKSGTIQREPPPTPVDDGKRLPAKDSESSSGISSGSAGSGVTRSSTSSALADLDRRHVEYADKRKSFPARPELESTDPRRVRFAVRSLGWVEIAEHDLTPDRSSKAVNKCIVDLSLGRNDVVSDAVGRWGDGKDLFMDLDEGSLKLLDPESLTMLNTQPIHTIRVWGVGRDNGKDFAYVARDRATRKHMCHVFRCDTPARVISNTLRDICKKIMIERSLAQGGGRLSEPGIGGPTGRAARPTSLAVDQRRALKAPQPPLTLGSQSFPTPMEEPKRTLQALYMGCTPVPKPSGIDVLNQALAKLCAQAAPAEWRPVNVSVAPSTVTVNDQESDEQLVECRVRFLSFLGIGRDVQQCGIIVHTSQDVFIAHGFSCPASAGPLCKTIEAACKLRYQKCLDALPGGGAGRGAPAQSRSFGQTLKSVMSSLAGRRLRSMDS